MIEHVQRPEGELFEPESVLSMIPTSSYHSLPLNAPERKSQHLADIT